MCLLRNEESHVSVTTSLIMALTKHNLYFHYFSISSSTAKYNNHKNPYHLHTTLHR